jgi:large subunit ribosomal protein L4
LTVKAQENQIIVVEDFTFETAKTKEFVNFAKNFKVDGKKVLVVLADQNNNVYLSSRNVPGARLMRAADINTYAVLNNNAIILTESSLAVINNL